MRVTVTRAFDNYRVGQILSEVPALFTESLIARGLVEKVAPTPPPEPEPEPESPEIITRDVMADAPVIEPIKRKRGRPRKNRPEWQ